MKSLLYKGMKTKSENLQPKILQGYVRSERVKCGKSNCRCAKGKLHGEYFYRYEWQNGRRVKSYVKREDIDDVIAACSAWRETSRRQREHSRSAKLRLREIKSLLRENESLMRQFVRGLV